MSKSQLKSSIAGSIRAARQCNRWLVEAKKAGESQRFELQRVHREEWVDNARLCKKRLAQMHPQERPTTGIAPN
jgi:hypothetical protein